MGWITLTGRGHTLDGGQRSSTAVFNSFSPCGQALVAETALGLMAVMVSVRQLWLRRQHPSWCQTGHWANTIRKTRQRREVRALDGNSITQATPDQCGHSTTTSFTLPRHTEET